MTKIFLLLSFIIIQVAPYLILLLIFLFTISKLLFSQHSFIYKLLILERLSVVNLVLIVLFIMLRTIRNDFLLLFIAIVLLDAVIGLALAISLRRNSGPLKINHINWLCSLKKT